MDYKMSSDPIADAIEEARRRDEHTNEPKRLRLTTDTKDAREVPNVARSIAKVPTALVERLRLLSRGESPWPFLLMGDVGTGKTCGSLAFSDYVCGATAYYSMRHLVQRDRDQQIDYRRRVEFWAGIESLSLLIVDEIGLPGYTTEFSASVLYEVLESRAGRPLILISNLDAEGIGRVYGDRIVSRASAGTLLYLTGRDRRQRD